VVYAAAFRSLAILEVLVHMRNTQQSESPVHNYSMFAVAFDEEMLEELPNSSLPPDWDAEPPQNSTKFIGDAWVSGGSSPLLSVPSVVVPDERNYLLNPNHKLFSRIQIGPAVPCRFDPRLL
jgi:RES domain-containing protein